MNLLFNGLKDEDITILLKHINYKITTYLREETIAFEGDACHRLGIILEGVIEIQKIYESGKVITIDKIERGHTFGEVIVFSDMNKYPSTIVASTDCKIMFINKEEILKLCSANSIVLNNFMSILSNKILVLNNKLKNMSYKTLKQKLANLIINEHKKQKNLTIKLSSSRKEMAEQLGIPRPSLSRELIALKDDGIITFDKNIIQILDINKLEDLLFQ